MKYLRFLAIQLLIFTLFVNCQSQTNENNLVGTWKVVEYKDNMQDVAEYLRLEAKEIALSCVYTFNSDKSMRMEYNFEINGVSGTFELFDQGKRIKMSCDTQDCDYTEEYVITSFNGRTMTWKCNYGKLGSLEMKLKKE